MAECVLNNNIFELKRKAYQQRKVNTIETKFAPPCVCIYID